MLKLNPSYVSVAIVQHIDG